MSPGSSESTLTDGVVAYQKQDYSLAEKIFRQILEQNPSSDAARVNLALTLAQQKKNGEAIAQLRRVLDQDPSNRVASEAADFIRPQLPPIPITTQSGGFFEVQRTLVGGVAWEVLALLGLAALFAGVWRWMRHAFRLRNLSEDQPEPTLPNIVWGFLGIALLSFVLAGLSAWDGRQMRATTIANQTPVLSFPKEGSAELIKLPEGVEVRVRREDGEWAQISLGDQIAGWVKKSEIVKVRGT